MRIAVVLFLLGILLALTPTVYSHEWASFKWACHRSGEHAGECYADPTLRDRLSSRKQSERRVHAYDVMQLDKIESTFPLEDGTVLLLPTCDDACWKEREGKSPEAIEEQIHAKARAIQVTVDGEPVLIDEMRAFIDRFDAFRKDKTEDSFVHHPIASYRSWWLLFYMGAAFMGALAYARVMNTRRRSRQRRRKKKRLKTQLEADRAKAARSQA